MQSIVFNKAQKTVKIYRNDEDLYVNRSTYSCNNISRVKREGDTLIGYNDNGLIVMNISRKNSHYTEG